MKKKPILLGLINPHDTEDLDVRPKGCSGHRLYNMLRAVDNDFTEDDYKTLFDRRNIYKSLEEPNYEVVHRFYENTPPGSRVVVLGEQVRRVLNIPKLPLIHPIMHGDIEYRQIPHPSGQNRLYNDKALKWLVGSLLRELAHDN